MCDATVPDVLKLETGDRAVRPDLFRSLTPEEFAKLLPISEEELHRLLDLGRPEPIPGGGFNPNRW